MGCEKKRGEDMVGIPSNVAVECCSVRATQSAGPKTVGSYERPQRTCSVETEVLALRPRMRFLVGARNGL